jgi:DNA-binding IclR family transcriptional regulator
MAATPPSSSTIQKALDILMLFRQKPEWTFAELQTELAYNKSTLSRILTVLRNNRFIRKNLSSRYELGINLFLLGHSVNFEHLLRTTALPHMQELSYEIGLTTHLGILEGNDVIIVAKAEPRTKLQMTSRVGMTVPAHCTAQGKTLLAFSAPKRVDSLINITGLPRFTPNSICTMNHFIDELERIRKQGYAVDQSEHEKHLVCVGVPILDRDGSLAAALSITGTVVDFPDEPSLARVLPKLGSFRDAIRTEMGYLPNP